MRKVSFQEIERLGKRLMAQNGDCIIIVRDGESDDTQCSVHCHTKETALELFVDFFQCNPELIPACQMALGIAMECDGDCENCDKHCNDEDIDIIGMN